MFDLYVLIPMASCVFSAVLLGSIFRRGPHHRANQLACCILAGAVWFSFFETGLFTTDSPQYAIRLARLSSLGWAVAGPLAIELVLQVTGARAPWTRRVLPGLWVVSIAVAVVTQTTPEVFASAPRSPWGFTTEVGPLFPLVCWIQVACALAAIALGVHHYWRRAQHFELRQSLWLALVIGAAIVFGLASHLFSALEDIPRTGSVAFLMLSVLIAVASQRFGYWILAPGGLEREIFATIPNGVALLHEDGTARIVNDGMARLLGCETAGLVGVDLTQRFTAPDVVAEVGLRERECELVPFSGSPFPVSVSTARIRDRAGQVLGRVIVVADLREVVGLRKRLVTSGRLAAVGELAAGIAHEINNPLTYVRANLSMLRQEWSEMTKKLDEGCSGRDLRSSLAESEELIDLSLEGVDRTVAIVRDVKSFSHAGRSGRELAELEPMLDAALRVVAPQIRDSIELVRRYRNLPLIRCAPQELKQVFLNLVVNASQAMEGGGEITVSARVDRGDVVVCVADEGRGIAPEDLERIFDPFFTTKPVGEGTGLGLALSYEIVRRHGGQITVESEPGRGSRFFVRLPIDGVEPPPEV